MNKWIVPAFAFVMSSGLLSSNSAWAKETSLSQEENATEPIKNHPGWIEALKDKHHLSDEHIAFMKDKGLTYPQMAIVSRLSEKSGKTVDDILDLRKDPKKDWDQIAKELEISTEDATSSIVSIRQTIGETKVAELLQAWSE